MKKLLLGLSLLSAFAMTSCKKEEDKATTSVGASGSWSFNGTTYTPVRSTRNDSAIAIYDNSGNTATFYFNDYPTKDGVYNITFQSTSPKANEVFIVTNSISPLLVGMSAGSDGKTLTVKVNSAGKVSVSCDDVTLKTGTSSGALTGTAKFSAKDLSE